MSLAEATMAAAPGAAAPALPLSFAGWGAALPDRVVTNDELARTLDTSDAWVSERTGIRARHVAGPGETTAALAAAAGRRALASAGIAAAAVDLLIVATTTPDRALPSTAADVAALLGTPAAACDVNAACAGFAYALHLAAPAVATGLSPTTLLIGAERMSSVVDPTDRTTAVLFGDGAGALVLAQRPPGTGAGVGAGVLASALDGDAGLIPALEVPPGDAFLRMDGPAVFRAATRALVGSGRQVMERAGVTPDDVAWYVPHQANRRIIDAAVDRMGLAPDRVVLTLDRHGNTSAASIPLALAEAADDGRIRPGDLVLTSAMGAGMSWGSVLLRWGTS